MRGELSSLNTSRIARCHIDRFDNRNIAPMPPIDFQIAVIRETRREEPSDSLVFELRFVPFATLLPLI